MDFFAEEVYESLKYRFFKEFVFFLVKNLNILLNKVLKIQKDLHQILRLKLCSLLEVFLLDFSDIITLKPSLVKKVNQKG